MSRIGQLNEMRALREAVTELQASVYELQRLAHNSIQQHISDGARLDELEKSRKPGRPKKEID